MARRPDVPKYKLTLSLEDDFSRRFRAYCSMLGEDISDVAARAIKKEMRGFRVTMPSVENADDEPAEGTVRMDRLDGRATG